MELIEVAIGILELQVHCFQILLDPVHLNGLLASDHEAVLADRDGIVEADFLDLYLRNQCLVSQIINKKGVKAAHSNAKVAVVKEGDTVDMLDELFGGDGEVLEVFDYFWIPVRFLAFLNDVFVSDGFALGLDEVGGTV